MKNLYEGLKILMKYHRGDADANQLIETNPYKIFIGRRASNVNVIKEHYDKLYDLGWHIDDESDRWVYYTP